SKYLGNQCQYWCPPPSEKPRQYGQAHRPPHTLATCSGLCHRTLPEWKDQRGPALSYRQRYRRAPRLVLQHRLLPASTALGRIAERWLLEDRRFRGQAAWIE